MGYARRRVEDAGRGVLSTGTGTPAEGWGLEDDDGWTPLVVRERTNEGDAESDSGESSDAAPMKPSLSRMAQGPLSPGGDARRGCVKIDS